MKSNTWFRTEHWDINFFWGYWKILSPVLWFNIEHKVLTGEFRWLCFYIQYSSKKYKVYAKKPKMVIN